MRPLRAKTFLVVYITGPPLPEQDLHWVSSLCFMVYADLKHIIIQNGDVAITIIVRKMEYWERHAPEPKTLTVEIQMLHSGCNTGHGFLPLHGIKRSLPYISVRNFSL